MVTRPTADLLAWIDGGPRRYEEAVDVWRTSCPRHSVWEDAIADGLVALSRTDGDGTRVTLSARGRETLERAG